jgi:hypothetical protein
LQGFCRIILAVLSAFFALGGTRLLRQALPEQLFACFVFCAQQFSVNPGLKLKPICGIYSRGK